MIDYRDIARKAMESNGHNPVAASQWITRKAANSKSRAALDRYQRALDLLRPALRRVQFEAIA